jgi:hypothetical protein
LILGPIGSCFVVVPTKVGAGPRKEIDSKSACILVGSQRRHPTTNPERNVNSNITGQDLLDKPWDPDFLEERRFDSSATFPDIANLGETLIQMGSCTSSGVLSLSICKIDRR